jgi:hypothetical protein
MARYADVQASAGTVYCAADEVADPAGTVTW